MKKCLILLAIIMSVGVAFPQMGKDKPTRHTQTIQLIFQTMVGDAVLQTGVPYVNAFGEPFTVRAFKYYVSDIQLEYSGQYIQYEGKHEYTKTDIAPHLVNEMDSTTKQISFTAPAGTITSIRFLVGVDSVTNTTGVQTGDLDPAKGMYWVWNTGYIMAKLEGTSAVAKSPGRQFTYDIGGYKSGEHAARAITLSVPVGSNPQTSPTFIVRADVLKWFNGVHDIRIGEQPMCHAPGKLAMQIADNYEQMFTVLVK